MIHNDRVYGKPLVQYTDTQAGIEAMTGLAEGSTAYATDTNLLGTYDGAAWTWGGGAAVVYEPLTNGDTTTPELLFTDDGDVLMVEMS